MSWEWSNESKRYRNVDTGRYLSNQQMLDLRDSFTESQKEYASILAREVVAGDIAKDDWIASMQESVGNTFIDQFTLGRGGRLQLTDDDYTQLSSMLDNQFAYLEDFAGSIDDLSEAQIAVRAGMYFDSATQAFEIGRSTAYELELPAYPGDGNTVCLSNCKCSWRFEADDDGTVNAYWDLGDSEHCPDCVDNASNWNPYTGD